ncbi:hypothetical protein D3C86_2057120 [compost metagenome]
MDRDPAMARICSANWLTVVSFGLPILTGPSMPESAFIRRTNPSTRSSTKQKERVCSPLP